MKNHICKIDDDNLKQFLNIATRVKILNEKEKNSMKQHLADFVVNSHLPPSVLEDPCLKKLAQYLVHLGAKYSNVDLNSIWYGRHTISDYIVDHVNAIKKSYKPSILNAKLNSALVGTTDIWTDSVNRCSYIDLTLHLIENFAHKTFCIGFK